jgi:hypothetical protein
MVTSPSTPPGGIEIFYSYAHTDEPLRDELEKHLSLLKRPNRVMILFTSVRI